MDKLDKKILKYVKEGKSKTEISEKTGKASATITYRIKRMRENGIDVPKNKVKKQRNSVESQNNKTDNLVNEMKEKDDKRLSNMLVDLFNSKQATIEQIDTMAQYYGIDLDKNVNMVGGRSWKDRIRTLETMIEDIIEKQKDENKIDRLNGIIDKLYEYNIYNVTVEELALFIKKELGEDALIDDRSILTFILDENNKEKLMIYGDTKNPIETDLNDNKHAYLDRDMDEFGPEDFER